MSAARLIDTPRSFAALLSRTERETIARLRDHTTADSFTLRGCPPAAHDIMPLFDWSEPDYGPKPLPGQLRMHEEG